MHVNTIGEQEIGFLYFFNPYYFRTSVKTTFKGKKFNKAAIKCKLQTGVFPICSIRLRCGFFHLKVPFQALHLIMKIQAIKTPLKVEKQS